VDDLPAENLRLHVGSAVVQAGQGPPERVGYLLKERVFDIVTVVDALRRIVDG
jgi:hypothetical protein